MSVMPPKAEVETHWTDVRFVPLPEIAMPVEKPSTASEADIQCENAFALRLDLTASSAATEAGILGM